MTNPKLTRISCLIDRTGSMESIRSDVEGRFSAFMEEQCQAELTIGDRVFVDLRQFDHNPYRPDDNVIEVVYTNRPIASVPPLTIEPRGGTPLYDAVAGTIVGLGTELRAIPEDDRPGTVIVLIATDGLENRSREYPGPDGARRVREMIEHQRDHYRWRFEFIGIGIDAFAVGGKLGVDRQTTYAADRTSEGVAVAYAGSSASVLRARKGR